MELLRSAVGASFVDVDGALEITQNGCTYRARKWRLTPELIEVIDTAIEFGFSAFWVKGHPSSPYKNGGFRFLQGSHHITFARAHGERWVFVVDGSASPPVPRDVTFNRGLRDFLDRIGQAHSWEHSGGHNLRVPRGSLRSVLERLDATTLDQMHLAKPSVEYFGARPVTDMYREEDLQRRIEEEWRPLAAAMNFTLSARAVIDGPIPDLVLHIGSWGILVVELKFAHAGGVELDQLRKYLSLPSLGTMAQGKRLHGVLIARDFNRSLIDVANVDTSTISLYSFGQNQGVLQLHLVAGSDVLRSLKLNLPR